MTSSNFDAARHDWRPRLCHVSSAGIQRLAIVGKYVTASIGQETGPVATAGSDLDKRSNG